MKSVGEEAISYKRDQAVQQAISNHLKLNFQREIGEKSAKKVASFVSSRARLKW